MKLFKQLALFPYTAFAFSLLLLTSGILVLAGSERFTESIGLILGIFSLLAAGLEAVFCFLRKHRPLLLVATAFFAFFLALLGGAILLFPDAVLPYFIPAVGLFLTVFASFKLRWVLELRKRSSFLYLFTLFLSVASILSAFLLGRINGQDGFTKESLTLFGIALILGSLLGLFCAILLYTRRLVLTPIEEAPRKERIKKEKRPKKKRAPKQKASEAETAVIPFEEKGEEATPKPMHYD